MKRIIIPFLFAFVFLLSTQAVAGPSSNVAWTSETRQLVNSADPDRGKILAAQCAGCHGETGISPSPTFPSLAGQLATYSYKQLRDYKDGKRTDNPMMVGLTKPLQDQDMADLAVFYADQPLPAETASVKAIGDGAEVLVKKGDGKRLLAPCAVCHGGSGQGSIVDVPALRGQQSGYLSQTMQAYKQGKRNNDIYQRMRLIAQQLTDEEIKAVADYYAAMGSQ